MVRFASTSLFSIFALCGLAVLAASSPDARTLFARQIINPNEVPSTCLAKCQAIDNTITACANIACICSQANANALADCVGCVVDLSTDTSIVNEAETLLNEFYTDCAAAGNPVTTVPVAGTVGSQSTIHPVTVTATATLSPTFGGFGPTTTGLSLPTASLPPNPNNPFSAHSGAVGMRRVGVWLGTTTALLLLLGRVVRMV